MSLDISLTDASGNEVKSLNWLRNPFGLCQWAEDNVGGHIDQTLWYVCNHWAYADSNNIDRALFKRVVLDYWKQIEALQQGYFFFGISEYIQFVEPYKFALPTENSLFFDGTHIVGQKYVGNRIAIPQEHFQAGIFRLPSPTLEHYKAWFRELVEFAELLQDKSNEFYCSN